ncbi:MAG TPA: hypothetical protein VHB99_14780, partial [Pirellulales bacterium]|nr:hypothetical protein [Pirellulales bacterium]
MKFRLQLGGWAWAATWLFGLLGLLVPTPAICAEAARAMPSGGVAEARASDRTVRPPIERADGEPSAGRPAAPYSAPPMFQQTSNRYDYSSAGADSAPSRAAMEPGAESRKSPRPVASQATARPISKQQPETGRTQAADRTASFAAARPAGPVLKPAQPPAPVRQV